MANPLGDLNEPSVRRSNTTPDLLSKLRVCVVHNYGHVVESKCIDRCISTQLFIKLFLLNCRLNPGSWPGLPWHASSA